MIIAKLMNLQDSSPMNSTNYVLCRKSLELKDKIISYSLNQFIEETAVSKSALMNFLKLINIDKFHHYKRILHDEYIRAHAEINKLKQENNFNLSPLEKQIAQEIIKSKRIVLVGDGSLFSLMYYQKMFIYLGINFEIPLYFGLEEELFSSREVKNTDLIIMTQLYETYEGMCYNRANFYKDVNLLNLQTNAKVLFIGLESNNCPVNFNYVINESSLNNKLDKLIQLFDHLLYYCANHIKQDT